ncbi:MAG: hypothetical protein ABMB14_40855, partial [Myxococcota bacterium]
SRGAGLWRRARRRAMMAANRQGVAMVWISLVTGCVGPDPGPTDVAGSPDGTDAGPTDTGPATSTHTGAPTLGDDDDDGTTAPESCGSLPAGPFEGFTTSVVHTEEDFDFDKLGYLLTQDNTSLAAFERTGASHLVSPNIGSDAAGIRSLPNGDVVVAQPDTGALRKVTYDTGATTTVLGGIVFPNGLEVGVDGYVYSTEYTRNGLVRQIDVESGDITVIAELDYPNNLALSPDEQVLYLVVSEGPLGGAGSDVVALDRGADGAWGPDARPVGSSPDQLGGITTDTCGNVYVVAIGTGQLVRIEVATGAMTTIAQLPSGGLVSQYSSLRFGAGIGAWGRTELFVTNRVSLTVFDVGVEGRHVLAAR